MLGLKRGGPLMGIVVLGIFAAAFGHRVQRRGRCATCWCANRGGVEFLAGKYLALMLFGTAVVLARGHGEHRGRFAVTPCAGSRPAPGRVRPASAPVWTAPSGIWMLAALGFGTLGAALAVVLRSPVAALAVDVTWSQSAESILAAVWAGGSTGVPVSPCSTSRSAAAPPSRSAAGSSPVPSTG